jgi:hypothetical protein
MNIIIDRCLKRVTCKRRIAIFLALAVVVSANHSISAFSLNPVDRGIPRTLNPKPGIASDSDFSSKPEVVPTPTPSTGSPLTISPKQGQQGKTYTISIRSADCEALNFQKQGYTLLKEENSGVKLSGDDNTVDGGCTYTAQLTVETSAIFGEVILKLKPTSGPTLTVPFSIAAISPGPVPPGIEPQVDVLWSVVPKNVVSDNFGKRVGNNFYCVEIVIGNSTGYDLQLASVGFKVGPIGPYAKVAADTRQRLAEMALKNNEAAIKSIVEEAVKARDQLEKCRNDSRGKCDSEVIAKNLEDAVTVITDRTLTGQRAAKEAARVQANMLSELSQQAYAQKIPVSSYRMSRGSVEHGQFWGRRNLLLNFVKAAGPFLTGFTPFFHVLNHRTNFSQGINIFSDPFEKGIELVFPDETVRQLQRLDEQMLRDGLTVLNNQQIRTRAFIPKNLLGLEGKLKDDWATVTQALGTLILVGDKIQYINRIQVTAVPSTEVKPPPTIQNIEKIFLIGQDPTPITITGQNLEQIQVTSNDSAVTPSLKPISSTTAELTIALSAGVKPGPKTLVFDSPTGSVIKTISVDYPVATLDLSKTRIPSAEFSPTKTNLYPLHIEGTNLYRASITVLPTDPPNALSVGEPTISENGKSLDADLRVPEKSLARTYQIVLTTPTLAEGKEPPTMAFTIAPQQSPKVTEPITYDAASAPTSSAEVQHVGITIKGDHLEGATITSSTPGFTFSADGTNADPKQLKTIVHIAPNTPGKATPFIFTIHNGGSGTVDFSFTLSPATPATP